MEQSTMIKNSSGITGNGLKLIALAAMLIDHFGAIIVENRMTMLFNASGAGDRMAFAQEHMGLYALDVTLRLIGRFGFPIFAFLIVEGFCHTRSMKRYALNLGIFALISELPFNLGFSSRLFYPHYQNVFFTLFLGLICIWLINELAEKREWSDRLTPLYYVAAPVLGAFVIYMLLYNSLLAAARNRLGSSTIIWLCAGGAIIGVILAAIQGRRLDTAACLRITFTIFPIAVTSIIADFLSTDYSAIGVLTIAVMYLLRDNSQKAFAFGCLLLTIFSPTEITAFLMLIPISHYNGKRGAGINKYLFYAFYPVHIGLLYLIAYMLHFTTFAVR